MSKGNPKPIRFGEVETAVIALLEKKTGLNRPEIVRRCVRFLYAEAKRRPDWNWIEETADESMDAAVMKEFQLLVDQAEAKRWLAHAKGVLPTTKPTRGSRKPRQETEQPRPAGGE